jgi:endonuclease G
MLRRFLAGLALVLAASPAVAAGCADLYLAGRAPELRNPKLAPATRALCYGEFAVLHSGLTRTPLWSAERLLPAQLLAAHELSRENAFHAEPQLPPAERAELADYARSGYDRGHMAPNGDMSDRAAQYESFTLANMVPQDADTNRHLWAAIESAVRKMARREGALFVVTGPAFLGGKLQKVGKVLVPTHLYKAVYSPRQGAGGAWLVENVRHGAVRTMTLAELERTIGIDPMPALTMAQKNSMLRLPNARSRRER